MADEEYIAFPSHRPLWAVVLGANQELAIAAAICKTLAESQVPGAAEVYEWLHGMLQEAFVAGRVDKAWMDRQADEAAARMRAIVARVIYGEEVA